MRDPRTQDSDLLRVRVLVLQMHDTAEQASEQLNGGRQVYRQVSCLGSLSLSAGIAKYSRRADQCVTNATQMHICRVYPLSYDVKPCSTTLHASFQNTGAPFDPYAPALPETRIRVFSTNRVFNEAFNILTTQAPRLRRFVMSSEPREPPPQLGLPRLHDRADRARLLTASARMVGCCLAMKTGRPA